MRIVKYAALALMLGIGSVHAEAKGFDLVSEASRFLGARNFTHFRGPWCKAALNIWLHATGHYADRSLRAIDALHDGHRTTPHRNAIGVQRHHVFIVVRVVRGGVLAISGNHGHRVGLGFYPYHKVIAFIEPRKRA